jgi:hypothetical protein
MIKGYHLLKIPCRVVDQLALYLQEIALLSPLKNAKRVVA